MALVRARELSQRVRTARETKLPATIKVPRAPGLPAIDLGFLHPSSLGKNAGPVKKKSLLWGVFTVEGVQYSPVPPLLPGGRKRPRRRHVGRTSCSTPRGSAPVRLKPCNVPATSGGHAGKGGWAGKPWGLPERCARAGGPAALVCWAGEGGGGGGRASRSRATTRRHSAAADGAPRSCAAPLLGRPPPPACCLRCIRWREEAGSASQRRRELPIALRSPARSDPLLSCPLRFAGPPRPGDAPLCQVPGCQRGARGDATKAERQDLRPSPCGGGARERPGRAG